MKPFFKEFCENTDHNTSYVECKICGKKYKFSVHDMERALRYHCWPRCCFKAMKYYGNSENTSEFTMPQLQNIPNRSK